MNKVVIRHQSGSKANQIENFPIDSYAELVLGRDQNANITYNPDQDDLVSRHHATLRIVKGDKLAFTLTDQDSSNGTFINQKRISGESE